MVRVCAQVAGGWSNIAKGESASIGGGASNIAEGDRSLGSGAERARRGSDISVTLIQPTQ